MADTLQLIQILSWLAGISSAGMNAYRLAKDRSQVRPAEPEEEAILQALQSIPQGVLDAVRERIEKTTSRYEGMIRRGAPVDEIDGAWDRVGFEVCGLLEILKKHNDGDLPDEDLFSELWRSFGCEKRGSR